jgi:phenylalanyl-tRNA synthetase alpha subunit
MAKPKAKHYPPAYKKYRKAHPTISVVLTVETKKALDAARGELDLSYAEFIKSLFAPDGIFTRLKSEQDKLKSKRIAFETEKKNLTQEFDKKKLALENERKNLTLEYNRKNQSLETERENLTQEYDEKNRALEDEKQKMIDFYYRKTQTLKEGELNLARIERFFIPCARCYQPILFDSTQPNWNIEIKPKLLNAFSGSMHYVCPR